jgi:hypothetical protein
LQLLDTQTLEPRGRIDAEPFTFQQLSFSPKDRLLAFHEHPIANWSRHPAEVRFLDVATGHEVVREKKTLGFSSYWKDDETMVVVDRKEKGPHDWVALDVATGAERSRTPVPKSFDVYGNASISSNEPRRMVVASGFDVPDPNRPFLAEWPTGRRMRPIVFDKIDEQDHVEGRSAELSPDERQLLSSGVRHDRLTFSESATGRQRFEIRSEKPFDFLRATWTPDGRSIVVIGRHKQMILDSLTFEPLMDSLPGQRFAFAATGRVMVTGEDAALVVWDLKETLRPRAQSSSKLDAAQLDELWGRLASPDARMGHRAMVALVRRPAEAVTFIRQKLPARSPDSDTFKKLVSELDHPRFESRDAAQNAIGRMGNSARRMIDEALRNADSLEAKRRLTALAGRLTFTEGDRVRWLRVVELLERLGTPEARATLALFRHVEYPEASDDAVRSLDRLARRHDQ